MVGMGGQLGGWWGGVVWLEVPGVSMSLKEMGLFDPMILGNDQPFFKGHGDSRYELGVWDGWGRLREVVALVGVRNWGVPRKATNGRVLLWM